MGIPFNKPVLFRDAFEEAVQASVSQGHFSGDGINTKRCEEFFRSRFGYERSLLTPSCTAALEMAALILALGPEDEVIVPSFTFVTSASAFALRGAKLVFADCEEATPNVSVDDILKKITKRTKAIVVVHYAGVPVDVHRLLEQTDNSIPVVEDCAHAIGSIDPNTSDYIGKLGCLSTFSFHETKNVCIGEGGLLVVNDGKLWMKTQIVREKGTNRTDFKAGRSAFYTWVDLGSSYLMSDIDAAVLIAVLKNFDCVQKARLRIWDSYDSLISPSVAFQKPNSLLRANAHMYFLAFDNISVRSAFCKHMRENQILVATHYMPLDSSPFVENMREKQVYPRGEKCCLAESWSHRIVRLPLFFNLSDDEVKSVIKAVNHFSPPSDMMKYRK